MPSQRRTAVPWGVPHSHLGGRLTRGGLGRPLAPVAGGHGVGPEPPRGPRTAPSQQCFRCTAPRAAGAGEPERTAGPRAPRGQEAHGGRSRREPCARARAQGETAVRAGGAAGGAPAPLLCPPLLIAGPCVSAAQTEGDSRGAVPRQLGAAGLVPFPSRRAGRTPVVPSSPKACRPCASRRGP